MDDLLEECGIEELYPEAEAVTPEVTKSILDEQITANRNNIRAWFREPANWANKERLTYREVAQQIASDKDLAFKEIEVPIDTNRPLGETKAIYQVELEGKKLREFPKEVYAYYQSLKVAIPKAEKKTIFVPQTERRIEKGDDLLKYYKVPPSAL